jgi:hypothetical protein
MKSRIQLLIGIMGISFLSIAEVHATALELTDACKARLERSVLVKARQLNETASIVGTKLLYGGERGGLSYTSAAVVRASDETEPTDYIVVYEYRRNSRGNGTRCVVRSAELVNDGLLPEVQGLEN